MLRRLTLLISSLALAAAAFTAVSTPAAHAADRDCGDFANQRDAQIFFLNNGGPGSDPHGLDSEGDGIACESNPCPCYYSKTPPSGGDSTSGSSGGKKTLRQRARVLRVIDGDTVKVKLLPRGPKRSVRLIGIDTPEVYGGVECGGKAASRSAKRMLPRRTRVLLISDPSQDYKDRYGRLLRHVHKGKKDINRVQVRKGHAEVYVYGGNPFKRVEPYRKAQRSAMRADRGMWGRC